MAGEVGERAVFEGVGLMFSWRGFAAWGGDADPAFGCGYDGHRGAMSWLFWGGEADEYCFVCVMLVIDIDEYMCCVVSGVSTRSTRQGGPVPY